jgi:hypothetical protein
MKEADDAVQVMYNKDLDDCGCHKWTDPEEDDLGDYDKVVAAFWSSLRRVEPTKHASSKATHLIKVMNHFYKEKHPQILANIVYQPTLSIQRGAWLSFWGNFHIS